MRWSLWHCYESPTTWFNISLGSMSTKLFWGGNINIIWALFTFSSWNEASHKLWLCFLLCFQIVTFLCWSCNTTWSSALSILMMGSGFPLLLHFVQFGPRWKLLTITEWMPVEHRNRTGVAMLQMLFSQCQFFCFCFSLGLPISLCHPLLLPLWANEHRVLAARETPDAIESCQW